MKHKNAPWDKPFYERVQQRNRALRPRLLKAQGKRLYRVSQRNKISEDRAAWSTLGWPSLGGFRGATINAFGAGGKDIYFTVERVEVKWLKPKEVTLLRLQGAVVTVASEDTEEDVSERVVVTKA